MIANAIGSINIAKGITGSSGANSGSISSSNGIDSLTILQGGIVGGTADNSGSVDAATCAAGDSIIHSIVIHGNITGDPAAAAGVTGAGQIKSFGAMDSVTLYGSLMGTTSSGSGSIVSSDSIGHISLIAAGGFSGSITGGDGSDSGAISGRPSARLSVAGQLAGGGRLSRAARIQA